MKEGGGRVCQEEEEQEGLLIRGHGGHHVWLKQPAPWLHCPLSLGCLTPFVHVSDDLTKEERGESCEVHISLYKLTFLLSPVCWLGRTPSGPRWGGYSRKTPYVTP